MQDDSHKLTTQEVTFTKVEVPAIGDEISQCRIAKWHVDDRAQVECGERLATLETDKVIMDLESEYTGKITRLFTAGTTVNIGDRIAKITSTPEDLQHMEKKKAEPAKSQASKEKSESSLAMFKLIALVLLAFVVVKYGKPLMEQISEKSTEVLDKKKSDGDAQTSQDSAAEMTSPNTKLTPPASAVRITKGYEAWEPAVRDQLEEWHADELEAGSKYKLTNIDVSDSQDIMEIRYRLIEASGLTSKGKVTLRKDGFGKRFIYSDGKREFLVYPPE